MQIDVRPCCVLCHAPEARFFAEVGGTRYWRCERCALTFMDAADRPGLAEEHAEYLLHENDPGDERYRAFLARLTRHLVPRLAPGARGLDYGCGPGPAMAPMLREAGYEVANYDPIFAPDEKVLACRYDFVTCTEVVEHFHCPDREFDRLDALLRPGGWLGVMTSMLEDDGGFASWRYRRDRTHVAFYKTASFDFLARRHGWLAAYPAPGVVLLRKEG